MSFQGCRQAQAAQQKAYEAFRREEAGYDMDQPGKGPGLAAPVPQVKQDENDPWWKELLDGIGQAWDNFTSGITQTLTDAANNLQATLTPTPTTQLRPTLTSTPCSGPLKLDSFFVILRGWSDPDERAARRFRTQAVSDTPGTSGCVSSYTHLRGNVQSGNGHRQSHYTQKDPPPLL
jgi:hypothetical protein